MSAVLMILPKVWATAARTQAATKEAAQAASQPASRAGGLRLVAGAARRERVLQPIHAPRGPHRLRLVQAVGAMREASAAQNRQPAPLAAAGPILLRRQSEAVAGVSYEFYRRYTEAMLRRYVKLSMEAGRVPSMLGRELFRGHVSSYKVQSFEDVSNFVIDISRCLKTLDPGQQHLVRRIALEEYTMEEAAAMLGMSLRTVVRRYREAIDRMTRLLLKRGMMQPLSAEEVAATNSASE